MQDHNTKIKEPCFWSAYLIPPPRNDWCNIKNKKCSEVIECKDYKPIE